MNEFSSLHGSSRTGPLPPLVVDCFRPWELPYRLQMVLPQVVQEPARELLVQEVEVQQKLARFHDVDNGYSCI